LTRTRGRRTGIGIRLILRRVRGLLGGLRGAVARRPGTGIVTVPLVRRALRRLRLGRRFLRRALLLGRGGLLLLGLSGRLLPRLGGLCGLGSLLGLRGL